MEERAIIGFIVWLILAMIYGYILGRSDRKRGVKKMTLQEYRAAYDRDEDFEPVTKELMQAWLDERIEAVKHIEEIKKSMNDYPLVWGRLIDGKYENEVDLCGWEPKLQLHIYEGIEHIADVLDIPLKCEDYRGMDYDYEYSFVYKGVRVFEISKEALY